MGERTAAVVLAEKIAAVRADLGEVGFTPLALAARLAEDPAITVRTDMVVERFVVEFHSTRRWPSHQRTAEQVLDILASEARFYDQDDHRIIVRPYPEGEK